MIPKFRAWVKETEEMYEVESVGVRNGELWFVIAGPATPKPYEELTEYQPDEIVLMQSTGLKDCNDREIYEGDVIKVSDGLYEIDEENPFVVVKWDEEAGGYTMKDFTGEFDALNIGWQIADKFVRVEVVGNIYENPELLEEAEKCSHSS